jgi:phage baseplate assembly protein W
MTMYKGFSSITPGKNFSLTDFELVKRDLQNHFYIRKGEKLMNPEFGTIIWDMLFEPLTQETKNVIMQDIKRIIANDPRISAKNVIVTQFDRGIQIELELVYITTGQIGLLELQFDQNNQLSTTNL